MSIPKLSTNFLHCEETLDDIMTPENVSGQKRRREETDKDIGTPKKIQKIATSPSSPISPAKAPIDLQMKSYPIRVSGRDHHIRPSSSLFGLAFFLKRASMEYIGLCKRDVLKVSSGLSEEKTGAYRARASDFYNQSCDAEAALREVNSQISNSFYSY
jgi:hypothetical protein